MMNKKRQVKVEVYKDESLYFDGTLSQLIGSLQKIELKVPERYRQYTYVNIEPYEKWQCSYVEVEIYYYRPENEEEKSRREKFAKEVLDNQRKAKIDTYNKLKKELGIE